MADAVDKVVEEVVEEVLEDEALRPTKLRHTKDTRQPSPRLSGLDTISITTIRLGDAVGPLGEVTYKSTQ